MLRISHSLTLRAMTRFGLKSDLGVVLNGSSQEVRMTQENRDTASAGSEMLGPIEDILEQTLKEATEREEALSPKEESTSPEQVSEILNRLAQRTEKMEQELQNAETHVQEVDAVLESTADLLEEWNRKAGLLRERLSDTSQSNPS